MLSPSSLYIFEMANKELGLSIYSFIIILQPEVVWCSTWLPRVARIWVQFAAWHFCSGGSDCYALLSVFVWDVKPRTWLYGKLDTGCIDPNFTWEASVRLPANKNTLHACLCFLLKTSMNIHVSFSHFIDWMYLDLSGPKIPGCLSVHLSVCLCVCLSVRARTSKLPGRFQWNLPQRVPYISSYAYLSSNSLT